MYLLVTTPKWKEFQESLARILQVSVGILTSSGELNSIYNVSTWIMIMCDDNPFIKVAYQKFFKDIAKMHWQLGQKRIISDPLGLQVGVLQLDDGSFILLWGGMYKQGQPARIEFESRLSLYQIEDIDRFWLEISDDTREQMDDKLNHVNALYTQLFRSLAETSELGHKMMILSAVEEINKLMVGLLTPEQFNLREVLELVVSSLIILFDAEGAWAISCQNSHGITKVSRGTKTHILQEIEAAWETAAADPEEIIQRYKSDYPDCNLDSKVFYGKDSKAFLGIVNPLNSGAESALSAFASQVVIAMEVELLYQALQKRVGTILNSVCHGIVIFNSEGRALIINRPAVRILAPHRISLAIGKHFTTSGFGSAIEAALSKTLDFGESFVQQKSVFGEADQSLYISWNVTPLRADDGLLVGAIFLFEDLTDMVYLQHQIQDWERLATAGEVAAGLAHEIRNPLATALAIIQLLQRIDNQEKQKQLFPKLINELQRMNDILKDFLSYTKPEAEQDTDSIDAGEILEEIRFLLESDAILNNVELAMPVTPTGIRVVANKNNLKQVFLNLGKNAIEAMNEQGRLEISVNLQDGMLCVTFQDNGSGIPLNSLQTIFRPFFTTKLTGTGLGLPISADLVKKMGGEIRVESKLGIGTKVHVFLPIHTGKEDGSIG